MIIQMDEILSNHSSISIVVFVSHPQAAAAVSQIPSGPSQPYY